MATPEEPLALPQHRTDTKLIPLRRVVTLIGCNRPRNEHDQSPSTDDVFERYPGGRNVGEEKAVDLWLTPDNRFIFIEHPKSGEREEVPMTSVRQFQRLTLAHMSRLKTPALQPRLVRSLDGERPRAS